MSRRALITGGAGFVGSRLCTLLLREGWVPVVFDRGHPRGPRPASLPSDATWVCGDIEDPSALEDLPGGPVEAVFHLASGANVPASVADPRRDFEVNVLGTLNVLEWVRRGNARTVLLSSSACVYAPGSAMPVKEDAPVRPSSPYGAAKLSAESYFRAYASCYGIDTKVVRLFNVYGPGMRKYFIYDVVRKLMREPRRLELLGDGEQIRDYLYVSDAAEALLTVAERGRPGDVVNVASGIPVRIRELAGRIAALMGIRGVEIEFAGTPQQGDVSVWYGDTSRLAGLGFAPRTEFGDGLAETIAELVSASR